MVCGFPHSCSQKGGNTGWIRNSAQKKSLLHFKLIYSWQSAAKPTSHLISTIIPCLALFSLYSILYCLINCSKMHSDQDDPFSLICPPEFILFYHAFKTLHNLTSTYLYLPSTTTPYSTPWSSQIGSLFVPCALLLLSLLQFCLLATPHPPSAPSEIWLMA